MKAGTELMKNTTSCDDIQDFNRSFFRNIEPGHVETSTFNQMPIASRSFRVVYQCYFQFFSTHSRSVRAKKKKKTACSSVGDGGKGDGKGAGKGEKGAGKGKGKVRTRSWLPRLHNLLARIVTKTIVNICQILPSIGQLLATFATSLKTFDTFDLTHLIHAS